MGDSAIREAPVPGPVPRTWDIQADVVVVGFGAAGACAALEAAAAGCDVVVLDRFAGGGATALSGGVIYAGSGTSHQLAAGVRDSPEAMFSYLSLEVGDAVSPATLREFCQASPDMLARAACAPTRPPIPPTATTSTTRAASCRPATSHRRRREGTGSTAAAPRAACCSPGWRRPLAGPAPECCRRPPHVG
jgi:succinate dehydrogenase/fumarate reductase flavoprotein subunit